MIENEPALRQLMKVFLEENKKLNLSAFRTEEHCWIGNILDSLSVLKAVRENHSFPDIKRLLDIGTGGGFPLLPLALSWPDVFCFGIEAIRKKTDAVTKIADETGLKNVKILNGRAEDLGHDETLRESFDVVTARAVAATAVLLEYCVPFLKVGGICVFWKSSRFADELASSLKAQELLGAGFFKSYTYDLGNGWGERSLLFFRKVRPTVEIYPRKKGIPKIKPL